MLVFIRNLLLLPLMCSFQYSKISRLSFLQEHVVNVFLISANLNLLAKANKESLQNVMEHNYISDSICLLFFSFFGSLAWTKLISSSSPKLLSMFIHSSNGFALFSFNSGADVLQQLLVFSKTPDSQKTKEKCQNLFHW